jgi:glycosyltransferase involved in cell wall biosynthesis
MYGQIHGRFFLKQDLGIEDDDTPDTVTISEIIETYPLWETWLSRLPFKNKQLFTMFETSDVHPKIIEKMKLFDKIIVPYDYLKNILVKHGVNCESLNWYTSPLIRSKPTVLKKTPNPNKKVFLYVGTNDVRKNAIRLANTFSSILTGTKHILIMKTNHTSNLPQHPNITYITDRLDIDRMAGLYNTCDYVVSFSRGEGVGLPMLEAEYFGKPVISHDKGVLNTIKNDKWIVLPSKEVPINTNEVPEFLKNVFHGTWWEVDTSAYDILEDMIRN